MLFERFSSAIPVGRLIWDLNTIDPAPNRHDLTFQLETITNQGNNLPIIRRGVHHTNQDNRQIINPDKAPITNRDHLTTTTIVKHLLSIARPHQLPARAINPTLHLQVSCRQTLTIDCWRITVGRRKEKRLTKFLYVSSGSVVSQREFLKTKWERLCRSLVQWRTWKSSPSLRS